MLNYKKRLCFQTIFFNPIALRKAKILSNFGLSECNRVKIGGWFETSVYELSRVDCIMVLRRDQNTESYGKRKKMEKKHVVELSVPYLFSYNSILVT